MVATQPVPRKVSLPDLLERLLERFDPAVFDVGRRSVRLRVETGSAGASADIAVDDGYARVTRPTGRRPDAVLRADLRTWEQIADQTVNGLAAFRSRRLKLRHDLHLGVGFLAAVAPPTGEGRLRLRSARTEDAPYRPTGRLRREQVRRSRHRWSAPPARIAEARLLERTAAPCCYRTRGRPQRNFGRISFS